jgi:hypothetical protein
VAVVPDKFLQSPFLAPGPISPVAISGVLPALPPSELAKLSQSQTFKGQQLIHASQHLPESWHDVAAAPTHPLGNDSAVRTCAVRPALIVSSEASCSWLFALDDLSVHGVS